MTDPFRVEPPRRFVVQRHELPSGEHHFDFMIERTPGGPLATWKLESPLPGAPGETVRGEPAPDHRSFYLDHEGEVSGGRGHVRIVARGCFLETGHALAGSDPAAAVVGALEPEDGPTVRLVITRAASRVVVEAHGAKRSEP